MARKIYAKAADLSRAIPDLEGHGAGFEDDEVLVDLPINRVVVRGGDILTRTDRGHIGTPNLFFDPERWSEAYEYQKQCGFVFTPRKRVSLVALASRIVFYETLGVVMDQQAARAAKVTDVVRDEWVEAAREADLCSSECAEALRGNRPGLVTFRGGDFALPQDWTTEDPDASERLARQINECLPKGLPASFHEAVCAAIGDIASFIDMIEKNGACVSVEHLSEAELQSKLREHLNSRRSAVTEGTKVGGGETDIVLHDRIVVENKVARGEVRNPFEVGPHYEWQARRYSMALCSRVQFVIVAYRPADEAARPPLPGRIRAASMPEAREDRCQIRVVVPFGGDVPSSAKRPAGGRGRFQQ